MEKFLLISGIFGETVQNSSQEWFIWGSWATSPHFSPTKQPCELTVTA